MNLYVASGLNNTYYGYLNIAPSHDGNMVSSYTYSSPTAIWESKNYLINNDNQKESRHIYNNIRYTKVRSKYAKCTYTCS